MRGEPPAGVEGCEEGNEPGFESVMLGLDTPPDTELLRIKSANERLEPALRDTPYARLWVLMCPNLSGPGEGVGDVAVSPVLAAAVAAAAASAALAAASTLTMWGTNEAELCADEPAEAAPSFLRLHTPTSG